MYNCELVRRLCEQIAAEADQGKALELISLLQAVLKEDQEEIRVRMAFLAKTYPFAISDTQAAD